MSVKRLYVNKLEGYNIEEKNIFDDLKNNLQINEIESLKLYYRYDIENISKQLFEISKYNILSEVMTDKIFNEIEFKNLKIKKSDNNFFIFGQKYLPGQFDQRADAVLQCLKIHDHKVSPIVESSKIYIIKGNLDEKTKEKIKSYLINSVDSMEADLNLQDTLELKNKNISNIEIVNNFIKFSISELENYLVKNSLAMNIDDIKFCQNYFKTTEKRNPTITEIRVLDTYWSDHCRHTTFLTELENIEIEKGKYSDEIKNTFNNYLKIKKSLGREDKPITLMEIAILAMKKLKIDGELNNLDESDEINACSIKVDVDVDGKLEKWLIMFKNETHNHPTEIEPFGGAATCLGGAIRDPLSGRAYVYQAMRITGSGDPRALVGDTLKGKLPQRKITLGAAHGYSSYGNQIGLATGLVNEIYDEGYIAKRMEVGAVIAAAPYENVIRKKPCKGDVVILLGGKTGRDGCGGATGSSKKHDEKSLISCGAEVQKGNAPEERKIQRFFRNSKMSKLIKKCNDFGAGGISVAVGELADSLKINLDLVPKKYKGLDGTEIAISESQERMAVVVEEKNILQFINGANLENLLATVIAKVTDTGRVEIYWRNNKIVDITREFIDSNGAKRSTNVKVKAPNDSKNIFAREENLENLNFKNILFEKLSNINVCSQKGLAEMFDSTIGGRTVLMPYGGKYQLTPIDIMVSKVPVERGETNTATVMSYGYNPEIFKFSPYHGAIYSVVGSVSKAVAAGVDYTDIRLSFQEYFERLSNFSEKWGKPFSALLGALKAQLQLKLAAIGGKDSMSGTFKDLNVPPTLISFAVSPIDSRKVISPEFKEVGNKVFFIELIKNELDLPDFEVLKKQYDLLYKFIRNKIIKSATTTKGYGIIPEIAKCSFGNKLGIKINENISLNDLVKYDVGSFIIEVKNEDVEKITDLKALEIGTIVADKIIYKNEIIELDILINIWSKPLNSVFSQRENKNEKVLKKIEPRSAKIYTLKNKIIKPKVFIPIFPGTNCEYDSIRAFEKAGGNVEFIVFNNLTSEKLKNSLHKMSNMIKKSQIIMIPGGFSAGDEPEGSGKYIANIFKNNIVKDSIMDMLDNRDGLMLGICNGFQALIKLGLVPYGEIKKLNKESPTLTFNKIGRHISSIVNTKIISTNSPWLQNVNINEIHKIPISHGEGRLILNAKEYKNLALNGQIATAYCDFDGNLSMNPEFNINGSAYAVEGLLSPDGRIFGKMGHSERIGKNLYKNINGNFDQQLFKSAIKYFK